LKNTLRSLGLFLGIVLLSVSPVLGEASTPKNIILVIGDGMGPEAVGLLLYYNRFFPGAKEELNVERLMRLGNTGYCLTYQYGTIVTDSASAATAMACGVKTRDGMIGKDQDGRPMKSILDVARKRGKATGLISNTRITHATPAGFYAAVLHRDMESSIASQFVEESKVDVALSSGAQFFIPKGTNVEAHELLRSTPKAAGWGPSKREDDRDLVMEARAKGYSIVASERELKELDPGSTRRILGLFGGVAFPLAIDRQPQMATGIPRLGDMTRKAIEVLSKNPDGFFLMVEAGQIDWAEHANDVAATLHEMMEMDEALGVIMEFAQRDPSTLVILTADHSTGGLAIAYNAHNPPKPVVLATGETWKSKFNFNDGSIFEIMLKQRKSFTRMVLDSRGDPGTLKKEVEENSAFSITLEEASRVLARDPEKGFPIPCDQQDFYVSGSMNSSALLGRLLGKKTGTAWAVGTHTHTPVMIVAAGPMSEKFRGLLDNTQVASIMAEAWGEKLPEPR